MCRKEGSRRRRGSYGKSSLVVVKSDKERQDVTGLEDAIFCHNDLFIAGCASFENTMKMAKMALNYERFGMEIHLGSDEKPPYFSSDPNYQA